MALPASGKVQHGPLGRLPLFVQAAVFVPRTAALPALLPVCRPRQSHVSLRTIRAPVTSLPRDGASCPYRIPSCHSYNESVVEDMRSAIQRATYRATYRGTSIYQHVHEQYHRAVACPRPLPFSIPATESCHCVGLREAPLVDRSLVAFCVFCHFSSLVRGFLCFVVERA